MAHGYHTLSHWNEWLSRQFLGKSILHSEAEQFSRLLKRHFGKHALLIGVPEQYELLNSTKVPCHTLVSPLFSKDNKPGFVEGDFHELPILTGSMDLVMLPHTLEFVGNPQHLLSEACRIIKPEGLIVISGFNPFSLWGLKKILNGKKKIMPWSANFIPAQTIKSWLKLSDFAMEAHESIVLAPPISHQGLHDKLHFMEKWGNKYLPTIGGAYVIIARAKVVPLTPIRMKWKQQLSGMRISGTISGNVARESE